MATIAPVAVCSLPTASQLPALGQLRRLKIPSYAPTLFEGSVKAFALDHVRDAAPASALSERKLSAIKLTMAVRSNFITELPKTT
jgi:hypothetical protein